MMCDYGHRFTGELDSQQSFADPKCRNVTSNPKLFYIWTKISWTQAQTSNNENICFPRQVNRFWFQIFQFVFVQQNVTNVVTTILIFWWFWFVIFRRVRQSSSKLGLTGMSISSKISKTFYLRLLLGTFTGISKFSRDSLLQYCSLVYIARFFLSSRVFLIVSIYVSNYLYSSASSLEKVWL